MFNFKKERFVKNSIGQGSFGEVFPYQKNPEDFKWVVKRTKAKKIEDLLRCLPEIVLGFSCDHPCIVPVKGYSIESKDNKYNVYMKLPRMTGGTLADELRRRSQKSEYYSENELVKHFYSLVSAVDYLHSKRISHGDIKINNILLDDKGNVKLCDIGSGKFVPDEDHFNTMTAVNGAFNYRAPEIIQHENALQQYHLEGQDEKKAQLMENILKREHLYLADAWSLGLTMLEICLLRPKLINAHNSVQLIEENLQKIRSEAGKRYSDILLKIVFDLVKIDPTQRLQVSTVKTCLEENFKQILTEDFKASLGLQQQNKQSASSDILSHLKVLNERAETIVKTFEEDNKAKEIRLNKFEETLDKLKKELSTFNLQIEKIKAKANQEVEEVSKKYEASLQTLKKENLALLERLGKESDQKLPIQKQDLQKKPQDESYRKKLEKVSAELKNKWNEWFYIKSQPYLSITIKSGKLQQFDNQILKAITEDIISSFSKEDLCEEIDGLELRLGDWQMENKKITDEGLKIFASQLGPRLSNLRNFTLDMRSWTKITNDGLKEFATQTVSQLSNLQRLELYILGWNQVTDEGLEVFVSHLAPKLTNVEHLALGIGGWNQISDKGLKVLASQLGPQLSNTKDLELNIWKWNKITDEGLKAFASQFVPNTANLNRLELHLYGLPNITSQGLDTLANQITRNLTNLQELTLSLQDCSSITKPDVQNLKNQLKEKIPKLKIYNSFNV